MPLHKFKLLLILPLLVSCSLTPLYKNNKNSCSESLHKNSKLQIKVKSLSGESYSVFKLKNILEQKKHIVEPLLKQGMVLKINLTENFASVGIDASGDTVRNQGRIAVDLTISPIVATKSTESKTSTKVIKLDSVSSYNLEAADEFSSETAKASVRDRLLIDLSEQIIRETANYLTL